MSDLQSAQAKVAPKSLRSAPGDAAIDAAPEDRVVSSSAELDSSSTTDQERLLTLTLETLRAQAEAFRRWAIVRAEEAKVQARETVEEQPIGAMAVALGVGMALGLYVGLGRRAA